MIKRIAALAGAGALLLGAALPVLAHHRSSDDITIRNSARVSSSAVSVANTGLNEIGGRYVGDGDIDTGDAETWAEIYNDVNYNNVGCDTCDGDITIYNRAKVRSSAVSVANTGLNEIGGKCVRGGDIDTGEAGAGSLVTNFVNTNVIGD